MVGYGWTWLDMVGYGWIHTKSNQILLYVIVYKTVKKYTLYNCLDQEKMKGQTCLSGGDRLTPP